PVWAHEEEEVEMPVQHRFRHGERLPLGLVALHLNNLKTPGESAFFFGSDGGTLIVGDAVIGKPGKGLCLLPPEKVPNRSGALETLNGLREWRFERLLVGDGESVLENAREVLDLFVERSRASVS